jgi:hypothetical protein
MGWQEPEMKLITIILEMVSGVQGLLTSGEDKLKQLLTGFILLLAGVAIITTLVLAGAGFMLYGLYQYLAVHLSLPATALIVSAATLSLAGLATGLLRWQAATRPR